MSKKHKHREAADIISNARQAITNVRNGIKDLTGSDPTRRITGVHNAIVFGRAVTNVLQTLRSVDQERFNSWYAPYLAEMRGDEMMKWIYALRTEILKEGAAPTSNMYVNYLDGNMMQAAMRTAPRPAGATSFFIGDSVGGSGWNVPMPDGSEEKYYVSLPPEVQVQIKTTMHFPNAPTIHIGKSLGDTSLEAMLPLYAKYLDRMVSDAARVFNSI